MLNTEQFASTQKASLEAIMGLATKAFDGVEQITALNLSVAKANLGELTEAGKAALSAKDPQALVALQSALLQPAAEKVSAYGRQVYDILVAAKAEIDKAVAEQAAAAQTSFLAAIDSAASGAPEGMGSGVAMFKSAVAAANNAFESMQTAGKQATEAAEANYTALTAPVVKAAKAKRA